MDGVEGLPHLAYRMDLMPSDDDLFFPMGYFLHGCRFESFDEVQAACQEFFDLKEPVWYCNQIRQLEVHWKKVINNYGLYFEE